MGGMSGYVGPPAGTLYGARIVMDFVQANVGVGLGVVCCAKFVDGITDGASLVVLVIHEGVQFFGRILGCCFLEGDASLFE